MADTQDVRPEAAFTSDRVGGGQFAAPGSEGGWWPLPQPTGQKTYDLRGKNALHEDDEPLGKIPAAFACADEKNNAEAGKNLLKKALTQSLFAAILYVDR